MINQEKIEIEKRAREKFEKLPQFVKQSFEIALQKSEGNALIFLRCFGFETREASRMIIFVSELN